jgi:hypothetical protein
LKDFLKERDKEMAVIIRKASLTFTLIKTMAQGLPVYRVTAVIPGFEPAYLVKPEGGSIFPNRSAAIKACRRRADSLGYSATIRNSNTTSETKSKKQSIKTI